jgi:hypothetical protein
VYGFCLFQDISRKLDKGCKNAKRSGKNVNIKAGIVKIAFKQKTSFFNKTEIFAEGKIRQRIVNKE